MPCIKVYPKFWIYIDLAVGSMWPQSKSTSWEWNWYTWWPWMSLDPNYYKTVSVGIVISDTWLTWSEDVFFCTRVVGCAYSFWISTIVSIITSIWYLTYWKDWADSVLKRMNLNLAVGEEVFIPLEQGYWESEAAQRGEGRRNGWERRRSSTAASSNQASSVEWGNSSELWRIQVRR